MASEWLKKLLNKAPLSANEHDYTRYTIQYDEIINAQELPKFLAPLSGDEERSYQEAMKQFDKGFQAERMRGQEAAAQLVRDLRGVLPEPQLRSTVVSFLIDHSGSMKGLRMLSAVIAVECATDALAASGISTEILGFTTVNWRGGNSRLAWIQAGRPRNPGRLCDLRHVVYAEAGRTPRMPWHIRYALHPELLRENIDGEALEWAAGRLDPARWKHRAICIISDGAPVDDSTLDANDDPQILMRHLESTEGKLERLGLTIGFLLIGDENVRKSVLHEQAFEPEGAALALLNLVRRAILSPRSSLH